MNSRRTAILSCAALAATLSSTSIAAAQEAVAPLAPPTFVASQPAQPGSDGPRTESKLMPELYVTGPILFGLTYGATIAITRADAAPQDLSKATSYAAIPVAGPWVMLGSKLPTSAYWPALVASGIGQAGGVAMTVAGLLVHRQVPLPSVATDNLRVTFAPSGTGAVAIGTF